jgi:inosine-uridine nucleoside N-ribohydrolase
MGGSTGTGNITPAAEFNIFFDAVAAKEVLSHGIPFTMIPLDLTHTVVADENVLNQLAEYKSDFGLKIINLLQRFQENYLKAYGFLYPPIHDPTAVYYLLEK